MTQTSGENAITTHIPFMTDYAIGCGAPVICPEQLPATPEERVEINLKTLKASSWAGPLLVEPYQAALEVEPQLKEAIIVDLKAREQTSPKVLAPWSSPSGFSEIALPLGSYGKEFMEVIIERNPKSMKYLADLAGVDEMDTDKFMRTCALHEFKHVPQVVAGSEDPEAYEKQMAEEFKALPFSYLPLRYLYSDYGRAYIERGMDKFRQLYGVNDYEEVLDLVEISYRFMPGEAEADRFAADMMRRHFL